MIELLRDETMTIDRLHEIVFGSVDQGDPKHVIAYEGLRHHWQGKSPCATGDPVVVDWGPKTDLALSK